MDECREKARPRPDQSIALSSLPLTSPMHNNSEDRVLQVEDPRLGVEALTVDYGQAAENEAR